MNIPENKAMVMQLTTSALDERHEYPSGVSESAIMLVSEDSQRSEMKLKRSRARIHFLPHSAENNGHSNDKDPRKSGELM